MGKFLTGALLLPFCASSAWASVNACPSTVGAPTATLAAINAGGGCELFDKQFNSFTSTPVGQISTIEMLASSSPGSLGSNTITGLRADFDGPGLWNLTPNSTTTSVFSYTGGVDQTGPAPAVGEWAVSQISLGINFNNFNASQMKAGDSITVRMEWCPVATTVTGCANLQFIQVVVTQVGFLQLAYTNSGGTSNNFLNVSGFDDHTVYGVRNTLTFVGTNAASTFPLISISNGFDETGILTITPEPSTFVLFGFALAGVGMLRHRRRKIL